MSRSSATENGHHGIPEATVNRLPVYLRALYALADRGIATVSSEELAAAAGVNSAKLRKDLSHLGSYGTRGVGYDVEYLVYQVSRELGLTQDWPVIIAGITSILNFAPAVLNVPPGVDVRKVDLSIELQILAFHAQRRAVVRVARNGERDWGDGRRELRAKRHGGGEPAHVGDIPVEGETGMPTQAVAT